MAVMKFNISARRFNPALLEQDADDLAGSDVLATSPPQGTTVWIGTKFNKSTRRHRDWRLGTPGQADWLSAEMRLERRHVSIL